MFCPKCGGGTYISEEELIKIIENTRSLKAVIKLIYSCRACSEKFSRIIHEDLENKKRDISGTAVSSQAPQGQYSSQYSNQRNDDAAENLKFF